MSFRLVPKSVTLNDLERRNGVILRYFCEFGQLPGELRKSLRSLSHLLMSSCVYLGSVLHSLTQSTLDIIQSSAITRALTQSLDNQFWKSRMSIPIKLTLYNTCILPIFLQGSECWSVVSHQGGTCRIDAVDQWCLRTLLGIKWHQFCSQRGVEEYNQAT